MRETQTHPKQPRDEQGRVHDGDARIETGTAAGEPRPDDEAPAEGRDRPPHGAPRGNSPWLGGG
ncbi:hypothetical protein D3C83_29850 [compost metagenome]